MSDTGPLAFQRMPGGQGVGKPECCGCDGRPIKEILERIN